MSEVQLLDNSRLLQHLLPNFLISK